MKHLRFSCIHLLTAAALVFTSCSDDDDPKPISNNDVKAPTVVFSETSIKANEKVAQEGKFKVEATLEDNVALASWAIDVDPVKANDDTDAVVAAKKKKWETVVKDLKGSSTKSKEEIKKEITVPADADLGKYTVTFSAKDKAGNEGKKTVIIEVVTKGTDTTDPTVALSEGSVKTDAEIELEGEIKLKIKLADNVELASWAVDVNPVKGANDTDADAVVVAKKKKWETAVKDLKGTIDAGKTEDEFEKSIIVPAEADLGEYTVVVSAKDKQGNNGEVSVKIKVVAKKAEDKTKPTITVDEGGVKNDDEVKIGNTFSFKLTFKDETELASWSIVVINDEAKKAKWGTALDDLSGTIGENDENKKEKTFSKDVTVPSTVTADSYTFSIIAKDKAGNEGKRSLTIQVVAP